MSGRAVWVTGVGAVTAAGVGASALADALVTGRSCVRAQPHLDGLMAGRTPDPPRQRVARHLERSAALFLAAAEEAWHHAGLDDIAPDPARCGVIEGSSVGPLADILEALRAHVAAGAGDALRPTGLTRFMTGAGGAAMAHLHHLEGPVLHISAGSVSAACAIGEAFQKIACGFTDLVVAGGAECPLQRDVLEHFRVARILGDATDEHAPCRPFDARRCGTVIGEGAGVLVLEAAAHAMQRGVTPLAIVSGFGLACEAFSMVAPDPSGRGVTAAARAALGNIACRDIDWIKTHGTGTRLNDAAEVRGLAALFGVGLRDVPLTSVKPTLGHTLGASGAVEAVAALLALRCGFVPPTLGTECADPALPQCRVVTAPESVRARHILLLAESFGGRCAALTLARAA